MLQRIEATCAYLKSQTELRPEIAIILGTGLGGLTEEISVEKEIPYSQIPGFVQSTVAGHSGKLIFGTIAGVPVMAMQGRFHFYEGYPMKDVTYPEVVMKGMGIKYLMVSNAAGGLNPEFKAGDIMLITDHINLFPEHPLRGKNEDSIGTRFPDMNNAYNRDLISLAEKVAASNNIPYKKGVYRAEKLSTDAERIKLFRERQNRCRNFQTDILGMTDKEKGKVVRSPEQPL